MHSHHPLIGLILVGVFIALLLHQHAGKAG